MVKSYRITLSREQLEQKDYYSKFPFFMLNVPPDLNDNPNGDPYGVNDPRGDATYQMVFAKLTRKQLTELRRVSKPEELRHPTGREIRLLGYFGRIYLNGSNQ